MFCNCEENLIEISRTQVITISKQVKQVKLNLHHSSRSVSNQFQHPVLSMEIFLFSCNNHQYVMISWNVSKEHQTVHDTLTFVPQEVNAYLNSLHRLAMNFNTEIAYSWQH